MDEKILIKSERCNMGKLFGRMVIGGAVLTVVSFVLFLCTSYASQNIAERKGSMSALKCLYEWEIKPYMFDFTRSYVYSFAFIVLAVIVGASIYASLRKNELTITDKRVYGVRAWGKRVDLPVDSVSATAKLKWGVAVATSSGSVRFRFLKNSQEIYDVLNGLVIERQKNEKKAAPVNSTTIIQSSDNADQLRKYKSLLDDGIITQEEFDAKKKQLLGL